MAERQIKSISHDGETYYLWADPESGKVFITAVSSIPYGSERIAHNIAQIFSGESSLGKEIEAKVKASLEDAGIKSPEAPTQAEIQESKHSIEYKNQFANELNRTFTRAMFHYHVGDTISSAIGQPFFYKGKISNENAGNDLVIFLEPNRQLNKPNLKFIKIRVGLNSLDYIDVRISYYEYRDGKTKDVTLWEHTGHGLEIGEISGLDKIISYHKSEIRENFEKAQKMEDTPQVPDVVKSEINPDAESAVSVTQPEPENQEVTPTSGAVEDLVHGHYNNAYEINRAIEKTIDLIKSGQGELTAEVKQFISEYSGMGGLEKFGATGKGLLYEYFTPDEIIKRMWGLAYKHGYEAGMSVIEPSCGAGRFLKYLPENTRCLALEINPYSKFITEVLYGHKAEVRDQYFEQLFIKNNDSIKGKTDSIEKFGLVIGNPPYGEFGGRFAGMGEKTYTKAGNYIEYFIMRGLDCLKPGGLLVMIIGAEVASGATLFLDSGMNAVKEKIAERGDLIDAYRLPSGVFDRTDVTSDIVVFKKK